jgi:hypothetical protein
VTDEADLWRSWHQILPLPVYDRLIVQLSRLGRVNGIAVEAFLRDDKFKQEHGPRVGVIETLILLLERSDDESLRV